jgi:hypothetical protein
MSRREGGERRLPHRDTGSGGCDDGHRKLVGGPTTQVLRRIADVCSPLCHEHHAHRHRCVDPPPQPSTRFAVA